MAREARAGVLNKMNDRWLEGTGEELKDEGGVEGGGDVAEKAAAGSLGSKFESDKVNAPS